MKSRSLAGPSPGADGPGCRAVLDALGDAVLVHDAATGKIRDVNRKFCQMLGYSPEEATRLKLRDIAGDGRHPQKSAYLTEPRGLTEWQIKDRSGRLLWVEAQFNRLVHQGKEQVCAVLRDITPRKQAEAVQLEIMPFFRLVTEESLAGVYLIQDGKFRYVNPVLAQKFGYRPEEIIDRLGPLDLVQPEDRQMIEENLKRRLSGEETTAQYCFKGRRRDGSTIHAELLSRSAEYQGRPAVMGILLDITQRVQAEQGRQASEERYRAIVEDQTELVNRFRPDGTVTFANRAVLRFFGTTLPELQAGGFFKFVPAEDRQLVMEAIGRLNRDHPTAVVEHRVIDGQGETRWMQWSNRAILDDQGRILEIQGVGWDITERKLAEEALKEAQERFGQLADNLDAVFWMRNLKERRILYINAAYERIWGRSIASLMERPESWLEAVHPEDREQLRQRTRRHSLEEFGEDEYRIFRPDGQVRWISSRTFPVRDGRGKIYRVAGISVDITGRKQAEEALKASEENYRTIFNAVDSGIAVVDLKTGNFVDVNQRWCQMTGYSREEARGLNVSSLCLDEPPYSAADAMHWIIRAAGEQPQTFEYMAKTREGQRQWVEIHLKRVFLGGRERLLAVVQDITERKVAEEALRSSEERFRAFMDNSPAIAWAKDEAGRYIYLNKSYEEQVGVKFEAVQGKTDFELWPQNAEQFRENDLAVLASGQPLEIIEETSVPGAARCWWNFKFVFKDAAGKNHVGGIGIDITARRRAEEALRISEDNYRTIFNSSTDGIAVVEMATGKFLDVNRRWMELSGHSEEEARELTFETFCQEKTPFSTREAWGWFDEARRSGPQIFEWPFRQKSGRTGWAEVNLQRTVIGGKDCILTNVRDITARKRAEQALRTSEAKYRNLVEQIPAITYIAALDDVSSPIYISPQIEAILGFTPAELTDPDKFLGQIHPEDRDRVLTELLLSYAGGGPFVAEYRMIAKSGRVVWLRDESRAVYDSEGRPLFLQGVALDITKDKKAEEDLKEANDRLSVLVQALPLAIIGIDLHGKVTSWNTAAERIFGWRQDEIIGRQLPIIPADKREEFHELHKLEKRGEALMSLELRRQRKDGSLVDICLSTAPLHDAGGRLTGSVGIIEDITARKHIEEALRESEARFRAVFERGPIGVALMDLQRTIQRANPALRQMLGYSESEMNRIRARTVTHPDDWEADKTQFTELVAGRRNWYQAEKRFRHKQGHWVWGRLSVSLVRDAAGQPQFVIAMVNRNPALLPLRC